MSGFGVGPIYVLVTVGLTAVAGLATAMDWLECGAVAADLPSAAMSIGGGLLLFAGAFLWGSTVFGRRSILEYVRRGELCTVGVYKFVRNPCYSGVMIACTGAILQMQNLWLLILPLAYYVILTLLVKFTEERWLADAFGQQYLDYCKRVNRCIPWFPKTAGDMTGVS